MCFNGPLTCLVDQNNLKKISIRRPYFVGGGGVGPTEMVKDHTLTFF